MKAKGKVLVLRAFPSSASRKVKQQTRICSLHELKMAVTLSTGPAHGLGRAHEAPPLTDGFWEREKARFGLFRDTILEMLLVPIQISNTKWIWKGGGKPEHMNLGEKNGGD